MKVDSLTIAKRGITSSSTTSCRDGGALFGSIELGKSHNNVGWTTFSDRLEMVEKLLCVPLKQSACSEVAPKIVIEDKIEDGFSSLMGFRDRVDHRCSIMIC